jgi:hypothetical protein
MPRKGSRRKKRRTHQPEEDEDSPRVLVIRRGKVGA